MKVLFIGGTGTLSTACSDLCAASGIELFLLLRGTRDHRIPPRVKILHGDFRQDTKAVEELLKGHQWDCVVDWVAYEPGDIIRDVEFFKNKTKRFIFISSVSAYQKPLSKRLDETAPIGNSFWNYADKKAQCERLLMDYHKKIGFPAFIVRPGATYAEFTLPTGFQGLGFGLVNRLIHKKPVLIHDEGAGLWTWTFNEDFAAGFVPLMSLDSAIGEAFHIVSEEALPWIRIYDLIGETFGAKPEYVSASSEFISRMDPEFGATLVGDKSHHYNFDLSKIKKFVPSYKTRVPLRQGLKRCADWYEKNKEKCFIDPKKSELMDRIIDASHPSFRH